MYNDQVVQSQILSSQRKIVTSSRDMQTIIETLSSIRVTEDEALEKKSFGKTLQFIFHKTDGTRFNFSCNGSTVQFEKNKPYEVENSDRILELWEQLAYEAETVARMSFLILRYATHDEVTGCRATIGTHSWSYDNGDESITGIDACSVHPLDYIEGLAQIVKEDGIDEIKLMFSLTPVSYTIRRWRNNPSGDEQMFDLYDEERNVSDGVISLSDDSTGDIYEIFASWQQGNGYFSFGIK